MLAPMQPPPIITTSADRGNPVSICALRRSTRSPQLSPHPTATAGIRKIESVTDLGRYRAGSQERGRSQDQTHSSLPGRQLGHAGVASLQRLIEDSVGGLVPGGGGGETQRLLRQVLD